MSVIETEYKVYGVEDVINAQKEIIQSFKEGEFSLKEFSTAQKENMEATRALSRAYSGLRMAQRVQTYELNQFLQVMTQVGYMGTKMMNMWQAYTVGQIRVEQASRSVTEAQKDVAKWQEIYNRYLEAFGEESTFTIEAYEHLTEAQDREREEMEKLAQAQRDNAMGMVTFATQIPGFIADIGKIGMAVKGLTTMIAAKGGLTAALGGLGSGLLGIAGPVGIGILALTGLAVHLENVAGAEGLGKVNTALVELHEPLMNNWRDVQANAEAWERAKEAQVGGLGEPVGIGGAWGRGGQFGIPYIPETMPILAHKGEALLTPAQQALMRTAPSAAPAVRTVNIYNTFGDVTSELDLERAGYIAFRKFTERLERKG